MPTMKENEGMMAAFLEKAGTEEAKDRVKMFQGLREMQHLYASAIKEINTKLEILDQEFKMKYDHNPIHHIESRQKTIPSTIDKLERKGLPISITSVRNEIYDMAGVRVICNYRDDVYFIADMLTSQKDIKLMRTRDYIKQPKGNGYRSLHLIVTVPVFLADGPVETPVEIQIRTIAMDFWASLEHHLHYKSGVAFPNDLLNKLNGCAQICAQLDEDMQEIYTYVSKPSEESPRG